MKIIIVGNGGTGKSTLGDELGKSLGLPVTHLDKLSWDKNWQRRPELKRWLIEYGKDKSIHEFHSLRELNRFLKEFKNRSGKLLS